MAHFVFPPPAPTVIDVAGGGLFPVRRIFCVGQNYAQHALEMGTDPVKDEPVFFTKPGDAATQDPEIPYPPATGDFHYEAELVVAIGQPGRFVSPDAALSLVFGYAVGCDLTRRDLQAKARKTGQPWDMAKGFDRSAAIGAIHPVTEAGHPERGEIALWVNGADRQKADLADMIWPPRDIVSKLSGFVALMPGDLIFTGTPAGVGALSPGDRVDIAISGVDRHSFVVVRDT